MPPVKPCSVCTSIEKAWRKVSPVTPSDVSTSIGTARRKASPLKRRSVRTTIEMARRTLSPVPPCSVRTSMARAKTCPAQSRGGPGDGVPSDASRCVHLAHSDFHFRGRAGAWYHAGLVGGIALQIIFAAARRGRVDVFRADRCSARFGRTLTRAAVRLLARTVRWRGVCRADASGGYSRAP